MIIMVMIITLLFKILILIPNPFSDCLLTSPSTYIYFYGSFLFLQPADLELEDAKLLRIDYFQFKRKEQKEEDPKVKINLRLPPHEEEKRYKSIDDYSRNIKKKQRKSQKYRKKKEILLTHLNKIIAFITMIGF
jgi:hypothetical protein